MQMLLKGWNPGKPDAVGAAQNGEVGHHGDARAAQPPRSVRGRRRSIKCRGAAAGGGPGGVPGSQGIDMTRLPGGRRCLGGPALCREDGRMTRTFSALSHLDCSQCQVRFDAAQSAGTCTCGSPLLARYDLEMAASLVTPAVVAKRPPSLWRYHQLLPLGAQVPGLRVGQGLAPLPGLAPL